MRPWRVLVGAGGSARIQAVLLLAAIVGVACVPIFVQNQYYIHIANMTMINIILVTGLNLISLTGQLSLCHAAFAGIGAYTSALLALGLSVPPIVGIFAGAAVSAGVALVMGAVILRLRGVFFVLITFLFGQIFTLMVLNAKDLTHGANGVVGIPSIRLGSLDFSSKANFFYFALCASILVVWVAWLLLRSSVGRAFASVEENLQLAESTGIDTRKYQILAFCVGSAFAGLGGGIIAHYIRYISPDTFTFWESVSYIVMMVVGGRGGLAGGVIGAVFLTPMPELLRGAQALQHIGYGTILILVLFFVPGGLITVWQTLRGYVRREPVPGSKP